VPLLDKPTSGDDFRRGVTEEERGWGFFLGDISWLMVGVVVMEPRCGRELGRRGACWDERLPPVLPVPLASCMSMFSFTSSSTKSKSLIQQVIQVKYGG
jgi:hypothetical protein